MKVHSYYNWKNEEFSILENPIRDVMGAFGNAEKWFADLKDRVLIDFSMPFLADHIHNLEHIQPERIDEFSEIPHAYHLRLPYPGTPEMTEDLNDDLDRLFEVCTTIVDEIDEALNNFIQSAKDGKFNALSLKAEELQLKNTADRKKILGAWAMWDNGEMSRSSFDNWCKHYFEDGE